MKWSGLRGTESSLIKSSRCRGSDEKAFIEWGGKKRGGGEKCRESKDNDSKIQIDGSGNDRGGGTSTAVS